MGITLFGIALAVIFIGFTSLFVVLQTYDGIKELINKKKSK